MTHPELLKHLEELGDDYEVVLLEPRTDFDQFIIGYAERGTEIIVLYAKKEILEYLTDTSDADPDDDDQDPYTMALEHYEFNMLGVVGQNLPAYAVEMVDPPDDD